LFSKEEIEGLMNDILLIGPRKPMGYLPISTLQMCGQDTGALIDDARINGLRAEMWGSHECMVGSGALFVWDAETVEQFIEPNGPLLVGAGWPDDHHMLVRKIATQNVAIDTPLHELIDALFSGQRYSSTSIYFPEGFVPFERGFGGYIWNGSLSEDAFRRRYS